MKGDEAETTPQKPWLLRADRVCPRLEHTEMAFFSVVYRAWPLLCRTDCSCQDRDDAVAREKESNARIADMKDGKVCVCACVYLSVLRTLMVRKFRERRR